MLYWVTTLVLLVYLVLVWLLGRWLPLHGSDVWVLRGVLSVLGIIGAAVAYFYVYKVEKAKQASGEDDSQPGSTDDLDALVREAVRKTVAGRSDSGVRLHRPVVQWTGRRFPKALVRVRFAPGRPGDAHATDVRSMHESRP